MPLPTHERAKDMTEMRKDGYTYAEIANKYGISKQRAHKIIGPMAREDTGHRTGRPIAYKGLQDWLKQNRRSERWLAIHANVNASTLCRVLKGRDNVSKKTIDAILVTTGLTYEEAFGAPKREEERNERI